MVKGKKGAELSINVIVILILAILALLVISVIFLGGAGSLNDRLKNIFGGTSVVYEPQYFQLHCEQYCMDGVTNGFTDSAFCNFEFKRIDTNSDGKVNLLVATCNDLYVGNHIDLSSCQLPTGPICA